MFVEEEFVMSLAVNVYIFQPVKQRTQADAVIAQLDIN